jgi:hypothetical protein
MRVIVTARPPRRKRPAKAAWPVEVKAQRIVQTTPKGRAWQIRKLEPGPEGEAPGRGVLRTYGLTLPEDWANQAGLRQTLQIRYVQLKAGG